MPPQNRCFFHRQEQFQGSEQEVRMGPPTCSTNVPGIQPWPTELRSSSTPSVKRAGVLTRENCYAKNACEKNEQNTLYSKITRLTTKFEYTYLTSARVPTLPRRIQTMRRSDSFHIVTVQHVNGLAGFLPGRCC
jgi:hypothetical protein